MVHPTTNTGEALRHLWATVWSIIENKSKGIYFEALNEANKTGFISTLVRFRHHSTMMWFQIWSTISAHRVPRKLDAQRNIRPSPPAESKNHHNSNLKDLSWNCCIFFQKSTLIGIFFLLLLIQKDSCSPSSLAPKHIWLVMLLFKSSTGLLFVGRRRVARVQLARLPQLVC